MQKGVIRDGAREVAKVAYAMEGSRGGTKEGGKFLGQCRLLVGGVNLGKRVGGREIVEVIVVENFRVFSDMRGSIPEGKGKNSTRYIHQEEGKRRVQKPRARGGILIHPISQAVFKIVSAERV